MPTVESIITLLNNLLKTDSQAIQGLVENRVNCSRELEQHPTVVIGGSKEQPTVGLLGILNGIAGLDGKTIVATYDINTERLIKFGLFVPPGALGRHSVSATPESTGG